VSKPPCRIAWEVEFGQGLPRHVEGRIWAGMEAVRLDPRPRVRQGPRPGGIGYY
jgi:hypothetical protein